MNRRIAAKSLAGLGLAVVAGRYSSAPARPTTDASPVVKTTAGPVQGFTQEGTAAFLGVPYGAPTGGSARFMPPKPPAPWNTVREANTFGDSCPQVPLGLSPFTKKGSPDNPQPAPTEMQKQLGTLFARAQPEPAASENCLVLNVWTPSPDSSKRPVMVWVHGGGFAVGSASLPAYDGARLAARGDVVVVGINHRLNVFGYLYLGDIGGDAFAQSGNVGMLDIVLALEWVRDNIANFGGDPDNVTIFGESGGAGKVSVLCTMPAAKGLFHKAIMQSGPCLTIADKARGTAIAAQLLKDLGLPARDVAALQRMDPAHLAAAANVAEVKVVPRVLGFGPMGMIPVVDGITLHHHPFDTRAAPESRDVPFLVGSTKDEAVLFVGPSPRWGQYSESEVLELLEPLAGARAPEALALYKKLHATDSPSYLLVDMVTDFWMRQAANQVAEMKAAQGRAPAYVYVLEWQINPVLRTPHGTDVSLVFDTMGTSSAIAGALNAQAASDAMGAAWVAFARTGTPNSKALPAWPAYDTRRRAVMAIDLPSHVVDDYGKDARRFWEQA